MQRTLTYNSVTIPIVPSNFVGEAPSLNDLNTMLNINRPNVINEYMNSTTTAWSNGKYYLLGQILTSPDTKLTNILLEQAIERNIESSIEIGGPSNGGEYSSEIQNEIKFVELIRLIGEYYTTMTENPTQSEISNDQFPNRIQELEKIVDSLQVQIYKLQETLKRNEQKLDHFERKHVYNDLVIDDLINSLTELKN
jgi:hypothetical protein